MTHLLCQGQLLLHSQKLMFGRDQVLLQIPLGGSVHIKTPFVVLPQSGHCVLETADLLGLSSELEGKRNNVHVQIE